MSNAAQAYAKIAQTTSSPREIEAQALLKAANKLRDVMTNWGAGHADIAEALTFNRKLWSILLSAVTNDDNQQTIEIRQSVANIGTFVLSRTMDIQLNPEREKLKSLIDINCNLAAGLSGRA